jgi:hypothetical protein
MPAARPLPPRQRVLRLKALNSPETTSGQFAPVADRLKIPQLLPIHLR